MAKGDQKQQATNTGALNAQLGDQNKTLWDHYNTAAGTAGTDYNSIMAGYRNFASNPFGNPNVMQPNTPGTGVGGGPSFGTGSYSGPAPELGNKPADDNSVNAFLASHGITDPQGQEYWRSHINSKSDGLQAGNADYWSQRISGGQAQNSGGGSGSPFNSAAYAGYQNFANGGGSIAFDPEFRAAMTDALRGYGSFASDGGFSPQAIQDIRARAIGPTRSIYSSAQANIDRQRSLQGGFSPNYTAATAKMARDMSSQISDANVNADASIAQMIQQGKMFGVSGQANTGAQGAGIQSNIDQFNRGLQLQGLQGMGGLDEFGASLGLSYDQLAQAKQIAGAQLSLAGLQGASSLYGTTPGMANMFGNQALTASGQQLTGQGLANNLAINQQGFPWKETISGIGSGIGTAADVYGKVAGAGGGAGAYGLAGTGGNIAGAGGAVDAGLLTPADSALIGGPAATGISAGASPALAGTTGAAVGSGSSAGAALSGGTGGASAAGSMIGMGLIPAGFAALNYITDHYRPKNGPPPDQYTVQQAQETAQRLLQMYGPDDPQYVQFITQNPWAQQGNGY